jgi:hypothetical protein
MALPVGAIPTPEQVHALIPTRPVFTATTRPTTAEVETIIANKAAEVDIETSDTATLPADLIAYARSAITFGAAADIEQGYYPEQQFGEGSQARSLSATYLRMLDRLKAQVDASGSGVRLARSAAITLVDPATW